MIATRRPFNGTFILLLGIHQKFTDSGVKQSFSFTLYIKILKNRGNIGYSSLFSSPPYVLKRQFHVNSLGYECL